MPFVETLESYSRALYLPLRGYVRRPFLFVTESIRDHIPKGLWDMRRAMEHTVRGSSRLIGPFDGFQFSSVSNSGSGSGSGSTNGAINSMTNNGSGIMQTDVGSTVNGSIGLAAGTGSGVAVGSGVKMIQSQPSVIHFFTSPYFLLLCFMSIVMNRINAIVAPRNPHPLKLSVRFALKLPAFYLLMKSALITLALLIQDRPSIPLAWLLSDLKTTYNESHALWLSFIAMGVTFTIDSFIANLHSAVPNEQASNMLEWAIQFHFTPSGRDILIISLIQVCQLLTLQFLSLSSRGRNYRLVATTFWAMLDLSHFVHAVYYRSSTYPSLQLLSRLPEVVVILTVCISMILHALTYIVTGGNVRRQMFEPRALPTMDEEFTLAVFKLGRACMEATRGVGLRNEVDSVILPFGTILDRKHIGKSRLSLQGSSSSRSQSGNIFSFSTGTGNLNRRSTSGFSNEIADSVETPGQRQQISRRQNRMIAMKAFFQSSTNLLMDLAFEGYNKVVPARYRRAPRSLRSSELGTRITVQELFHMAAVEYANERAKQSREREKQKAELYRQAELNEEEEEELYIDFLSKDFTSSDDEDEDFDVDYVAQDNDEGEDEDDEMEIEVEGMQAIVPEDGMYGEGSEEYGIRHRSHDDLDEYTIDDTNDDESPSTSAWRSLSSFQEFFLDTSFMSIFMSSKLQETPLTRSQYRLTMDGTREFQQDSKGHSDEGGSSSNSSGSGTSIKKIKGPSSDSDTKVLLTVLKRYRKSVGEKSSLNKESSSSMAPPPLVQSSPADDGNSSINNRMLCVVCQTEPRGILLRPCRCLALCNECREILASR
ncbi:hypothetical protein BGZ76_000035, partial [Entomortierella beljakovae]